MRKRPLSITLTGWLFVVVGVGGLVAASVRLAEPAERPFMDFALAAGSGLLAAAGGAFTLRGHAWARWVLAVWMAGHIVIGYLHSIEKLAFHAVVFAPLLYLLFRPRATEFFRGDGTDRPVGEVPAPGRTE